MHAGFCRLYRVVLVMYWRSGAREIVNFVHLNIQRECNVMPHQFKIILIQQVSNIVLTAGKEIIHTNDVMPLSDQSPA